MALCSRFAAPIVLTIAGLSSCAAPSGEPQRRRASTAAFESGLLAISDPDEDEAWTRYSYDVDGNLIVERRSSGETISFEYSGGLLVSLRDARGQVTDVADVARLDSTTLGIVYPTVTDVRLDAASEAPGFVRMWGDTAVSSDPVGVRWDYNFDERLVLSTEVENAIEYHAPHTQALFRQARDGTYKTFAHVGTLARTGRTFVLTDADGVQHVFDGALRLVKLEKPGAWFLDLRYDLNGQLERVESQTGHELLLAHDSLGRVVLVTNRLGERACYSYDANSRLVSVKTTRRRGTGRRER